MNFLKEPSRRSTALDSLKAQLLLDGGRERESKILRQVDRRHAARAHGGQERRGGAGGGVQLRLTTQGWNPTCRAHEIRVLIL
jgi:hypothetical protein